ncbi:unnamed protein product [Caenorhabditis auriculariae]|uniref:Uncharacterized protein n=1 Tax=Caenorhabditis auriculariae TaxID=2777116 RepID=A0A8S1HLN0_9PELO|nr:unnamed protein product [Caenorhabditis auriculariae]
MDWLRGRGFWGSPPGNTSDGSQAPANRPPGAEDSNERRQLLRNSSAGIGAMGAKQSQENQGCQDISRRRRRGFLDVFIIIIITKRLYLAPVIKAAFRRVLLWQF